MRLNLSLVALSLVVSASVSGCALTRTMGWNQEKSVNTLSEAEQKALIASGKSHWAKRLDRAELELALKDFEKVATANPNHYESHAYLVRGYYLLADGHLPDSEMNEKKRLWEIGTSWGERALATNAAFREKVKDGKVVLEDALDLVTKEQVDAVYWTATNLGKWARNSNITTALKYKTRVKKMIERVQVLDPTFFHGAPDRYWGAYYATLPALFGGSLDKSNEYFQKSMKAAPNYLGTKVLYADALLRKRGDRAGFRKTLEQVLQSKPDALADLAAENTLEQRKAKDLLAREAELFD
jgi:tetratricopeptide (TPR) repeat protein